MKLIIAGSRSLVLNDMIIYQQLKFFNIYEKLTEVISGNAIGIDKSGERFATIYEIDLKRFPADWNTHGTAAGPIRNKQMAEYADALLLIWDGESRGSKNMKENMLKLDKPVYEVILKKYN
jgi:hypothetical protein